MVGIHKMDRCLFGGCSCSVQRSCKGLGAASSWGRQNRELSITEALARLDQIEAEG